MPGRPPKPTALHILQGTGRKSRMKKRLAEPVVSERLGAAPEFITSDEEMSASWAWVSALPQVTEMHRPAAEHFCVLGKRFRQDARGERTMTASERQTYHSVQMQLGVTPASAAKTATPAKKADDPWAQFG
jgi:hypothetical protein